MEYPVATVTATDDTDSPPSDTRARDSLLLVATLHLPQPRGSTSARIRNLSAGGMMAEYAGPIAQGDALSADVRGLGRVSGRVAWVAEGRIGIAFDKPVDPRRARKPVARRAGDEPVRRHAPL